MSRQVKDSIAKSDFKEAIEIIDAVESNGTLGEEEILRCKLLRARVLTVSVKHKQAEEVIMDAMRIIDRRENDILTLDGKITFAYFLWQMGNLQQAWAVLDEAEDVLDGLPDLAPNEADERRAEILHRRGTIVWNEGELPAALEYTLESVAIRERLGDKISMAACYNNLGVFYNTQGETDLALTYQKKGLAINEELNSPGDIATCLNNIGVLYRDRGELSMALEYHKRGLAILQELGLEWDISFSLYNLGLCYQALGVYDLANEHLQKSLDIRLHAGNDALTTSTYLSLLMLNTESGHIHEAEQQYKLMKAICSKKENADNKLIALRCRTGLAVILKSSERAMKKIKAQGIFQQIVDQPMVNHTLTTFALLNLCELLIMELRTTGNEAILVEVKDLAKHLLEIAQDQHSFILFAETCLLLSKIASLEMHAKESEILLYQAEITAIEKGMRKLEHKAVRERDALLDQSTKWNDLNARNGSLTERLELTQLEDLIVAMIKRRAFGYDEEEEEAMLLLILTASGHPVYSYCFAGEKEYNEQLIAGFLSAFATFSEEALAASGSVERITYEDCTLIVKQKGDLNFGYMFRGESFGVVQKVNKFMESIRGRTTIWDKLRAEGEKLDDATHDLLNELVAGIFVSINGIKEENSH